MDEKALQARAKRKRLVLLILCAGLLVLGALIGIPRYGNLGRIWVLTAGIGTAYNAYLLLGGRAQGGRVDFSAMEAAEKDHDTAVRRKLQKLEGQFHQGQVSYDEYMRRRMEIINGDTDSQV